MADVEAATAPVMESTVDTTGREIVTTTTAVDESAPHKTRKIIRKKKRRPARVQIDPSEVKSEPPPQTGTIFNIWYNKWSGGDRESSSASQTAAKGRCNVAQDTGYTQADKLNGSYFCLFFARGVCPRGSDCQYLHRIPTVTDLYNPNVDCFGRDRFADYRDDMGGVGSFMRPNRTIYVGRIHVTDDIEETVARHFAEWGQVERTRVLNSRGVAFITYTNEANAQFAREAMAHQSLDHEEILNVRWATADPNPMAQAREARRIEEQAAEAVRAALPAEFVAELEGRDPEARKRRKIEGSFGLEGYEAPDDVWYRRTLESGQDGSGLLEAPEAASTTEQPVLEETAETATASGDGIFSSAALAALSKRNGAIKVQTAKEKKPAVKLVNYGSDDDDDE